MFEDSIAPVKARKTVTSGHQVAKTSPGDTLQAQYFAVLQETIQLNFSG